MIHFTFPKLAKIICLLIVIAAVFGITNKSASAMIAPDPGGVGVGSISPATGGGTNYTAGTTYTNGSSISPFYDVGNSAGNYTYSSMQSRVYAKKNSSISISIDNGYSDCNTSTGGNVVGPDYTENGVNITVIYTLYDNNGPVKQQIVTNGGCLAVNFGAISTSNLIPITPTPDADGYINVEATVAGFSQGQGEDSFRINASNIGSGTIDALAGSGANTFGFGYRAGDLNDYATGTAHLWAGWSSFALPVDCSSINSNTKSSETVNFYDTDAGRNDWNRTMRFELQEQTIDPATKALGTWTPINSVSQASMGSSPSFNFTAQANARYRVVLIDVGVRNTIRISIPNSLSPLYSRIAERPSLSTCNKDNANCTPTNIALANGQVGTLPVFWTNTGNTTWSGTYKMIETNPVSASYAVSSSSTSPVPPSNSTTFNISVGPNSGTSKTFTFQMADGSGNKFGSTCTEIVTWTGTSNNSTCSTPDSSISLNNGDPYSLPITMTNNGTSTWSTSYKLRQTNPAATADLPNPVVKGGSHKWDIAISGKSNTSQTLTYQMQDANGKVFGGICRVTIKWSANNLGVTCTTKSVTPGSSVKFGTDVTIVITLRNKTGAALPSYYQIRQVGPIKGGSFNLGSPNIPAGGTRDFTFTPDGSINGRNGPTTHTETFTYGLFNPNVSTISSPIPGCSPTVVWSACSGGACPTSPATAKLAVGCGKTVVTNVNLPATYTTLASPTPKLITKVPIVLRVEGNGIPTTEKFIGYAPNGGGSVSADTYSLVPGMWPHRDYKITLRVEGGNGGTSATYPDNGTQGPPWYSYKDDFPDAEQISTPGDCLKADCVGPSNGVDAEPGQTKDFYITIKFHNYTSLQPLTNDGGGYHFSLQTDGGLFNVTQKASTPDKLNDNGDTDVNVNFSARADYTGEFGATLEFDDEGTLSLNDGLTDGTCGGGVVTPATRPFLQVWGGDINVGGGFATMNSDGGYDCNNNYPDYVSPAANGLPAGSIPSHYAGIKTFGLADNSNGSLSDFGAVALGIIPQKPLGNTPGTPYVHFGAQPYFSNTTASSPAYNGQLNSTAPSFCTADYYDEFKLDVPPPTAIGGTFDISNLDNLQYLASGNLDLNGGNIPMGRRATIFVNGDVNINSNIFYDDWDTSSPNNAPSFTLVVKGNINVTPNVTKLDGLYIAQPSTPGNEGDFNTCADDNINQFCNKQLMVNGAVVARRILPLRSSGTLNLDACPDFFTQTASCDKFHKPAEIFNYIPAMLIANPNFKATPSNLEGLYSLPPVF